MNTERDPSREGIPGVTMDPSARLRASGGFDNVVRGKLTDRKIEQYIKEGYYTAEFKEERKKLMDRKRARRQGNFNLVDDRMIYNPL